MKFIILCLTIVAVNIASDCYQNPSTTNVITVKDGGKPYRSTMYLNRKHWTKEIIVLENTLNDTALFGGNVRLIPGKKGLLYRGDCFMDSMAFIYAPYKATKGRFVIQYTSY